MKKELVRRHDSEEVAIIDFEGIKIMVVPGNEVVSFTTKIDKVKFKVFATVNYNGITNVDGWYTIKHKGQTIHRRIYAFFVKSSESGRYFDKDWSTDNTMQTTLELVTYALAKILAVVPSYGDTRVHQGALNYYLEEINKNIKNSKK